MPFKHLAKFLRSVIPADPWQLVFLLGVVFLFVSPRLPWNSSPMPYGTVQEAIRPNPNYLAALEKWRMILILAIWPLNFAGIVGYYVCWWPGERTARRLFAMILLPGLAGLTVLTYGLYQLDQIPEVVPPLVET